MKLSVFKNKRTSHPKILKEGYKTTSNEIISISPSISDKVTLISSHIT